MAHVTHPSNYYSDRNSDHRNVNSFSFFTGHVLRVTDVSRSFACRLVDYFLYKTFPGQSLYRTDVSWTDVSQTICINNYGRPME